MSKRHDPQVRPFDPWFFRYFDDDSLQELADAYKHLAADWEVRRQFVPKRVAFAVDHRLELVRHAWALLLEPVPESFY